MRGVPDLQTKLDQNSSVTFKYTPPAERVRVIDGGLNDETSLGFQVLHNLLICRLHDRHVS